MRCGLVTLVAPSDADFETVAGWLMPTSPTAVLTGDTRERVTAESVRARHRDGHAQYWMVRSTADDTPIGVVQSARLGSFGTFSIGGAVAEPALWSRGYGAAAFGHLIDHLFYQEAARRVQFQTAAFNRGMIEVLTRGGFTLEGVLRDFHFLDGEYHDSTLWSIMRWEFEEAIADPSGARYPLTDRIDTEHKVRARRAIADYISNEAAATSWSTFRQRHGDGCRP